MRHALFLTLVVGAALAIAVRASGFWSAYHVAYGALTLMALMISATFFWLWRTRATSLALGMTFSWLGGGSVMGWWWTWNLLGQPANMQEHPALFGFVALYITGAMLHFAVIGRSFGWPRYAWIAPPVGAVVLAWGLL